ncbi:MAG: AraC family transcriptional regulator, partial [Pseudomonadota bacterium]
MSLRNTLITLACLLMASAGLAQDDPVALDREVQDLKKEVLALNRELFLLEEELLFPANSQVAMFVSMDIGDFFALDAVQIKVNGREVANYLYSEREAEALIRGGVHRIHIENLKV